MGDWVFTEVSVAGAPPVFFCVDPPAGGAVGAWFLEHDWIDEPVQRVFLGLIEPGLRVLDLGSHLGTFALPAARLGAHVLAVDASPSQVELLRAAARHNGFDQLEVVNCAVSDGELPIKFVEDSIHGHVVSEGEDYEPLWDDYARAIDVPVATVDELLDRHGWDRVDVIKMDIEGCETVALAGMRRLHGRGCRPLMVFECNGHALPLFGSSPCELRDRVERLGYELLFIDHLRPGTLVEASAEGVQSEAVCDYLAYVSRPDGLARRWKIEPQLDRETIVTRVLDSAASEGYGYRRYAARLLADGPPWLREEPETGAGLRALAQDLDPRVRTAVDPDRESSWAVEHALTPEPPARGLPPALRVWAQGVSVSRSDQLLLENAWFRVRAGQLVGIVSENVAAGSGVLRVLAGRERPATGKLEVRGRAVLLASLGDALEGGLTVRENILLLGTSMGCEMAGSEDRVTQVAEIAGVAGELDNPIDDLPAVIGAKLALAVAVEVAAPELLLVDLMPAITDARFRDWILGRSWELRRAGSAIVQAVFDADQLLGPAERVVWIGDREIRANGHGASVLDARWRRQLGLRAERFGAPAGLLSTP